MRIAGLLLLLVAATASGGEPPGDYYENKAFGFKLRVPKDWREVPAPHAWIASKHLGKRELEAQRGNQYWSRETPELWVAWPRLELHHQPVPRRSSPSGNRIERTGRRRVALVAIFFRGDRFLRFLFCGLCLRTR